ncbi:hypothetical protein PY254_16750 [Rhodanobacter sp. AS-Z3]|uniref:hypothetical protein n=1 Tax=Rhodanobacter sp. AS-Z3 TaxID=3031330 RepID=UPI00247A1202|nr:hypothetical protein [Rhodanobacter sp. AS-Z3]WEN14859.1 hypothetical protein PY254_16750 [Rhodanobacter sp. AS-Z3]
MRYQSASSLFHNFKDDGAIFDRCHRHQDSSDRFVLNHTMVAIELADDATLRDEYLATACASCTNSTEIRAAAVRPELGVATRSSCPAPALPAGQPEQPGQTTGAEGTAAARARSATRLSTARHLIDPTLARA